MEDLQKYQRAQKQVANIKGFYSHALSYVIVIAFLAFINLKYSPKYLWFLWTAGSWGIGLFFHGLGVFGKGLLFGKEWEDRKIREFMEQDKQNKI
jgi:hypothetical protein